MPTTAWGYRAISASYRVTTNCGCRIRRLEGAALEDGKRRAAGEWIAHQRACGIDIVSDGEQFRKHFVHGFLEEIEGIDWQKMTTMGIRNDRYDADVPTVTATVRRPRCNSESTTSRIC